MSRELEAIVRREACDLIFASRPFSWVVGGRIGTRLALPVVWRAGTLFNHPVQPPWLRLSRAAVAAGEHRLHLARGAAALARHIAAPMFVLHNGVDTQRFSPSVDRQAARAAPRARRRPRRWWRSRTRLSPEKGLSDCSSTCAERLIKAEVPGVQRARRR